MPVLLPSPVFRWFVPAQDGSGLVPAEGYKAKFYAAGTTTAKTIYEPDGTAYPSPSNVATLNAEGYAEIWLGDGSYKLVVTDPDDAEVYSLDNINGEGNFTSGFVDTVIATDDPPTNGLAQVDTSANHFVWCAGYWQIGDGGHGFFWNETSSAPDDTGYVIASTFDPTKRWYRVPDEDDGVRAQSFGYVGTVNDDLTNQLLAACAFCTSYNKTLKIGPGSDATIDGGFATLDLYAPEFILEAGSMLTSGGTMTETHFHGRVSGTPEQHFTGFQAVFSDPQVNENPEWFGASTGADNTTAFGKWFASLPNGGAFTLPPGTWPYNNTTAFPYPTVPLTLLGTIDATTGSDIPPGVYFPSNSRFRGHQFLGDNGQAITASGGGFTTSGSFSAAGDITTSGAGAIFSANAMTAGSSIIAGTGTSGVLAQRAGYGTNTAAAMARDHVQIGAVSTSGTGATTLMNYTLTGNSLFTTGDSVIVEASGKTTGGSTGNRTIAVRIGSQDVFAPIASIGSGNNWVLKCEIFKASSTGYYTRSYWGWNDGTFLFFQSESTTGIDWTIGNFIGIVGTSAVGAIEQNTLSISYAVNYNP